jgi:hypothetical protein
MKLRPLLYILIACVGLISCDKPCVDFKCDCIENLELPCYNIGEKNYFLGYIDGTEFCLADGEDVYAYHTSRYNGFTTTPASPELSPSATVETRALGFWLGDTTLKEFSFKVVLKGPSINLDSFSIAQQLDELQFIDNLPLRSDGESINGFDFLMTYACVKKYRDKLRKLDPDIFYITMGHSNPSNKQPDDSYMRVVKYRKSDLGYAWQYDISFELRLKLYYFIDKWETFGTLKDAVFNTQTIVYK